MNSLEVSGDAYEVGRQHGESLRPLIRYCYQGMLCRHASAEADAVPSAPASAASHRSNEGDIPDRQGMIEQVAARWPDQLEEVQGYADGAGVAFEDAFDFNFGRFMDQPRSTCTNLAFKHSPNGPILGGTLDDTYVYTVQTTRRRGAYAHVGIVYPGWLSFYGGVNEHGLAVSGSSAVLHKSRPPMVEQRAMFWSIYTARLVLETCKSVGEAVDLLKQPGIPGHGNHIMIDASGDGVVVESNKPRGPVLATHTWDDAGVLWCGNFFRSEISVDEAEQYDYEGSAGRYRSVSEFAARGAAEGGSIEFLKEMLTSHDSPEPTLAGICNPHTVCAVISVPQERRILVAERYPCAGEFHEFRL